MKTYKFILLFFFLLSYTSILSQHLEPVWVKHWGNTLDDSIWHEFLENDSDGNIIVVATVKNTFIDTIHTDGVFIAKYASNGDLIWLNRIDSTFPIYPYSLKIDNSNNIYLLTFTFVSNYRIFELVKYNSYGEKQWGKNFKALDPPYFPYYKIEGIEVNEFDEIFLGWYFEPGLYVILPDNDTIFGGKYHILKYNSNGDFINNFNPFSQCAMNGYCPLTDFKIDSNNNTYHLTPSPLGVSRLIKYDYNYNYMLNVRDFPYFFLDIFLDNENNIYTSKIANDSASGFSMNDTIASNNLFILKYNNVFEEEWVKKFKGYKECIHPLAPSYFKCITEFGKINILTHQNSIYVYGLFKYKFSIENDTFFTPDSSAMSYFISKFDEQGNYHWTEVFDAEEREIPNHSIYNTMDLIMLNDGSLLCGLMFESEVNIGDSLYTSRGGWDILLMRLQETGTGLKPAQQNKSFSFELYPNPANDVVNIEVNTDANTPACTLKVFDFLGALVYEKPVSLQKGNNNIRFSVSHLPQGMYFVSLDMLTEKVVRKLVKY
jgi:hypothetical protein